MDAVQAEKVVHAVIPGLSWSLIEMDPDRALPALTGGAVDIALVHH